MNDPHRRSTLHPPGDSGSRASAIPLPSTIKKSSTTVNPRMSLAGPAVRPPSSAANHRTSMMLKSQNANPLLMSASKQNLLGKTPLHSSTRRQSTFPGAIGATPAPSGSHSQPHKDPRPVRDRSFQSKERSEIVAFFQNAGIELSMSQLVNIQSSHYRAIFETLIEMLDPYFPFDPAAKFEDIFFPALRGLQYPYLHGMDSKWLVTVASPHSWPHLLGVLHWLVDMCKLREKFFASGVPTVMDVANVPDEFDSEWHRRTLAYDYYDRSYPVWLDNNDVFVEPNQLLEDRYAKKNERIQQDVDSKRQEIDKLKIKLQKLQTAAAPLAEEQEKNAQFLNDLKRYNDAVEGRESQIAKALAKIKLSHAEIEKAEEYLTRLRSERDQLSHVVEEQNLSPEEAHRMTTDYETLSRSTQDLKQKITDTEHNVMSLEVNLTNRISSAEEILDTYNIALATLGLLPPLPPPHQDVNLALELNTASSDPQQLLVGPDIRKVIKPTLNEIAEQKRLMRAEVENERIRVDNEIEKLVLDCDNMEEENRQLEKKAEAVNEQANDIHAASQQDTLMSNEAARNLESMIANARTQAIASGMGAKSRLQQLQLDYREQVERVNRLKDETVRAILKNSNDIAEFKREVAKKLGELHECAEMS